MKTEETVTARQRLNKRVAATTNAHAIDTVRNGDL
jgi:hypothetical protein